MPLIFLYFDVLIGTFSGRDYMTIEDYFNSDSCETPLDEAHACANELISILQDTLDVEDSVSFFVDIEGRRYIVLTRQLRDSWC